MANNSIRFGIGFNVDNNSLKQLKASLREIQKMTAEEYMSLNRGMGLDQAKRELGQIKTSVKEVQTALNNSFNSDLGAVNIAKMNKELSNLDINKIARDFDKAGARGKNAFRNLASELSTTNLQLKETHDFLNKMAETMGNTIRWGITSSIMNSFTGSIQKAYSYVAQLDESLTNIRIVSGQSAEQMEVFAKKANDAAKALGTTTTQYTEGALIFYQQGLSDEEVVARTNTTIKMANALGESADQVSDYMTAIWNNFAKGSTELQRFGDVITALGASTASSSKEIADGLEKFAAIAESTGLSYEYATSALATVVSTTRQSAETVGTALTLRA